jgi:hypothetical protein
MPFGAGYLGCAREYDGTRSCLTSGAFPLILSLAFLLPAIAHAQESEPERAGNIASFDTEHIFGFAEGSDIDSKGELEIESATIGSFGELGSYSNINNETSLRYGVTN